MINVLEDLHQLFIDNIMDDLYVIVINRKIASFETSVPSLDEYTSTLEHIIGRMKKIFSSRRHTYNPLCVQYTSDLPSINPKQSPRKLESSVERLLSDRKYSIFLSESDAILGKSLYEFDFIQKQQLMVEQQFSMNTVTSGPSDAFNHTLSVSINTAPTVQVLPLKEAMPNVYTLFDMFIKKQKKRERSDYR